MIAVQIGMDEALQLLASGESRIAWEISERDRVIMKRLGQEGGDTIAKN
jgi:hypothetical protein